MASSLDIEAIVARNANYAQNHQPLPLLSEMQTLNLPPLTTVIISCADPRVCPEKVLDLKPGEALVFRVIGGRVTQFVLREILTLDSFLGHGRLQNLMIIHHTDCGASHFTSDGVKKDISSRHPQSQVEVADWKTSSFDGLSIADSVLADIEVVKADKMISEVMKANTKGFVFDIKTGLLEKVPQ